jgi:hypothetical protein
LSFGVSVVEEPLGKILNRVLRLGLECVRETLGDHHADFVLHKVLDIGVLIAHDLVPDFVAHI